MIDLNQLADLINIL